MSRSVLNHRRESELHLDHDKVMKTRYKHLAEMGFDVGPHHSGDDLARMTHREGQKPLMTVNHRFHGMPDSAKCQAVTVASDNYAAAHPAKQESKFHYNQQSKHFLNDENI
jgi:hypothetical protein